MLAFLLWLTKGHGVRTYFDTLLHRKRGEYGPLWLFEMDSETWAIVWDQCLEDEDTCRLVLSEDPTWFNREWHKDGRRPNPMYETPDQALEEIIRSLHAMKETFDQADVKRSHYAAYAALAEYHLYTQVAESHPSFPQAEEPLRSDMPARTDLEAIRVVEGTQLATDPDKTQPMPASQVSEAKKPWEVAATEPTASNFKPDMSLHAKMEWACNNVPRMSRLRILREGAELLCNQLIEKHYRA